MNNLGLTGQPGMVRAEDALNLAISDIGRLRFTPWNKDTEEVTLLSGTSSYTIGSDILTGISSFRGIVSMWHTDQRQEIVILNPHEFNSVARGSTETGRPLYATVQDKEQHLEVWPIPDADYTVFTVVRVPLDYDDVPEEYQAMILWRAVMNENAYDKSSTVYMKARELYAESEAQIESEGFLMYQPNAIEPEYILGEGDTGRGATDSGKWYNL